MLVCGPSGAGVGGQHKIIICLIGVSPPGFLEMEYCVSIVCDVISGPTVKVQVPLHVKILIREHQYTAAHLRTPSIYCTLLPFTAHSFHLLHS